MAKVRKLTENKIKPPYKLFAMMVLFALLFGVFFGLTIYSIARTITSAQANYVIEQATLVRYEKMEDNATMPDGANYQLIYKYVSKDNVVYEGVWKSFIADEDYAKSRVGKKVAIYVEHNLHEHSLNIVNYKNHLIIFSVPTIGALLLLIDMIIKIVLYYRYSGCDINRNEIKDPKRMIIPNCFFISFLGIFFVLFASNLGITLDSYKSLTNANFVPEKVEIVFYTRDVLTHTHKRGEVPTSETHLSYSTYYEYEINGNLYFFCYEDRIEDENTAKDAIGKDVTMYIDKDKGIIENNLDFGSRISGFWIFLVATIVLGVISVNWLVRIVLYFVELRKMTLQLEELAKGENIVERMI